MRVPPDDAASTYDAKRAAMAPMKDALHLVIGCALSELPEDSNILCVGAGTGAELLALGEAFPHWRFTAVDPAEGMLEVCRERVEAAGMASRCRLHQGTLDSLPGTEPFDAATCVLVSHYLGERERRIDLFRTIASRVRAGGSLVNADLAADPSATGYEDMLEIWHRSMERAGMPSRRESLGRGGTLLAPSELESILVEAGWISPIPVFQWLLIRAWVSTCPSP